MIYLSSTFLVFSFVCREKLERIKDDNTKYHYVMREINKSKEKIPILVKDEEGNVPSSTAG